MERRKTRRIYEPFSANVVGVDRGGTPFDFKAVLDNISSGGLYLSFPRSLCSAQAPVEQGTQLSITVDLSSIAKDLARRSRLVAHGEVLRTDIKESGACGVAVKFTDHSFLG
jgi:hypothetical protein